LDLRGVALSSQRKILARHRVFVKTVEIWLRCVEITPDRYEELAFATTFAWSDRMETEK